MVTDVTCTFYLKDLNNDFFHNFSETQLINGHSYCKLPECGTTLFHVADRKDMQSQEERLTTIFHTIWLLD